MRNPTHRTLRQALVTIFVASSCAVACSVTNKSGVPLEPRYVTVHNTLAAMGLDEVGPIERGSLAEGREERFKIDLVQECTTIVALGSESVRDLDVTLLDATEKEIAHDVTHDAEAVMRACVESPGTYTLRVKMAAGAGEFIAARWRGAAAGPVSVASANASAAGTCESPIALVVGTVTGNTAHAKSQLEAECGDATTAGPELVYRLEVPKRQLATIEVDPRFDSVLYVRRENCDAVEAQVACNDDVDGRRSTPAKSRIATVLDAGTYYVIVDGFQSEAAGSFRMTTTLTDIPTLEESCRQAPPLVSSGVTPGTTNRGFNRAEAQCGEDAKGGDVAYRVDVNQRSRVRVTEHSDVFAPVVHMRRQCVDANSEIACSADGIGGATLTSVLDPGSYTVFADSSDEDASGDFSILAEVGSERGAGVAGDACGDAILLPTPMRTADDVMGDTFAAHDDVSGKCGGAGAGDVIYRVEIPKRARFLASIETTESEHVMTLWRTCGDASSELSCGKKIETVLDPGTYYLAVDGANANAFGKFTLNAQTGDVAMAEAACRAAPTLKSGDTVRGGWTPASTFTTSCGAQILGRSELPDRVYKIVLASRARVAFEVASAQGAVVVAIRKHCADASSDEVFCALQAPTELEAGTYYVVVESAAPGPFSLSYRVLP